jgi:hypothetical protein
MKARSTPSTLWDYYNPDSRVELAPSLFLISSDASVAVVR